MGCRQQWDLLKSRKYQQIIVKMMGERENGENIENPIERINCKWNCLQEAINAAQEKILPKKKQEAKQAWITEEILQKMKERKKYKGTVTYTKLDKEIKRDCIKAKEIWVHKKCEKIEGLSKGLKTKEMFKEIKDFTNKGSETGGCIKS